MKKTILLLVFLIAAFCMKAGAQIQFNICGHVTSTGPAFPADGATISGYISQGNGTTIGQFSAVTDSMGNYCTGFFSATPDTSGCAYLYVNLSSYIAECNVSQSYTFSSWLCNDTTVFYDISGCDTIPPACSVFITDSVAITGYLGAWPSGTAPFQYVWIDQNQNDTIFGSQYITPNAFGQYCVEITDANGCVSSACYYYGQNYCTLQVALLLDSTPCMGPLHSLGSFVSGAVGNVQYSWSTGDTGQFICNLNTGTYCLQVTDSTGCMASACYDILSTGACYVSIYELTDSAGANYLHADFTGNTALSYQWQSNGAVLSSGPDLYPSFPGDYCVVVSDDSGCTATACYVFGQNLCSAMFASSPVSNPDSANWVNLYAYPYGTPPFTFTWSFSDGTTMLAGSEILHYFVPANGWDYACVEITDANGCMSSYCDYIAISDSGSTNVSCYASFGGYFDDISGNAGEVFFNDYSWGTNGDQVVAWNWDFGDGSNSTLQNPTHVYTLTGNYTICLTIADAGGCSSSYCETWYIDTSWWGGNSWGNGGVGCDANFIATQDTSMPGMVYLVDLSYGGNLFYTWSFVNLDGTINQTISSQYPFISFDEFGCFTVCLQITDTNGSCQDYFCDTVCVDSTGLNGKTSNWGLAVIPAALPASLLSAPENTLKNFQTLRVFPNPASEDLNIEFYLAKSEPVRVEIIDFTGRTISLETVNFTAGSHTVKTDLNSHHAGVYFVKIFSENLHHSEKVVKLK